MAGAVPAHICHPTPLNALNSHSYCQSKSPIFTSSLFPYALTFKPFHSIDQLTLNNSSRARRCLHNSHASSGFTLDSQLATQESDSLSSLNPSPTHDVQIPMPTLESTQQIIPPRQSLPQGDQTPIPALSEKQNLPSKSFGNKNSVWVNPSRPKTVSLLHKFGLAKHPELISLAERLDACEATEEAVSDILSSLGDNPTAKEAVTILNNMQSWEKAYLAFKYFKAKQGFEVDSIVYNVAMKVFRKGRQWELVEELLEQMLAEGIQPDNITFSTVISCARQCRLPHKAVEWFEKMHETGCVPDEVTYTVMIDAYGRAGKINEALSLYDKARDQGWRLDTITFSTLIRMYGISGNYEGVLNTFEEMKAVGAKPNLVIFNTMLDAMGRAGRPWQVKSVYKEMLQAGFLPNRITFSALIRAYGKARWPDDALEFFGKMKEEGHAMDVVLYNTLLTMCADMGRVDDALGLFDEMSKSETCRPDNWSYTCMVGIYANVGQMTEAEKLFHEMLEAGFEPNVYAFTSLIQGYGKSRRFDDVVRIFNQLCESNISPDDRLCGCLLSVLTLCQKEQLGKVLGCIEKANSKLGAIAKLLAEDEIDIEAVKEDFRGILAESREDVRKPYCNCLIDLCWNLKFFDRVHELLDLAISSQVYTNIQSRSPAEWCLNLKTLSLGAALAAFQVWVSSLWKAIEDEEELPPVLAIHTGHGKHKFSDKGLATVFESHLREMGAPFHESPDRVGWFLTTRVAATTWLQSRNSSALSTA